jgi:hypothetical protein
MNFDTLIEEGCLDQGEVDTGTVAPAYELILKPTYVIRAIGEPAQFRAFLKNTETGEETEITQGLTYRTSNTAIALIGPANGRAFGGAEGITDVSVEWNDMMAFAQMEVTDDCANVKVGMILLVDNSQSMDMAFTTAPVPEGELAYPTRLALAKAFADQFVSEVNETKDYAGLIAFNQGGVTLSDLTQDMDALADAVATIAPSSDATNMGDGLSDAIAILDAAQLTGTIDKKVIVLFSDGENKIGDDPIPMAQAFRDAGGIIVVVGVRASEIGFPVLKDITTEGMFINALPSNTTDAKSWLGGLKGYFCAGNCTPQGNETVSKGQLNYTGFANWDVVQGEVDLLGGTYPYEVFNFLPGNGLYVDMAGSGPSFYGKMRSKTEFPLVAGRSYKLSFKLAGNQRFPIPYQTRVRVENPEDSIDETIEIADYAQDFTDYSYTFVAPSSANGYVTFEAVAPSIGGAPGHVVSFGNLLDAVVFEDLTAPEVLLSDNFDTENTTFVDPACVADDQTLLGYGYGYCPGYGCLNEPIPDQVPDPNPLSDEE